jgi:hypothetical protein
MMQLSLRAKRNLSALSCRNAVAAVIEPFESRLLLSASVSSQWFYPDFTRVRHGGAIPAGSTSPSGAGGLSVAQVRGAYGVTGITFNGITGDGTGQTIALVDAYNDPTIATDLQTFDAAEGLPNPTLTVVGQTGSTTSLPANGPTSGSSNWSGEEALDVEWAHAIAPRASILVVECTNNSGTYLEQGDAIAAAYAGVSVVSNSWGGGESSGETSYDSYFTTPSGHAGVSFFASAGDSGGQILYPSVSPNVVAVGGTQLTVSGTSYSSEAAWTNSGGGISTVESQPSFQAGTVTATKREVPDVSIAGGQNSGSSNSYVPVADSYSQGSSAPWEGIEGTSWSSPMMAALVAVADQGRVAEGLPTLSTVTGTNQADTRLYQLSKANFHDITTGSNSHSAAAGYDEASGIGSPIANVLVPDLAGAGTVTGRAFVDNSGTGIYGGTDTPVSGQTVYLDLNNDGTLDNSEPSTVTNAQGIYTFTDEPAGGSVRLTSAAPTGYVLSSAAAATISYGATDTANFIYKAVPSKLVFAQQPAASVAFGSSIGTVTVDVENSVGSVVGTDSSTVTLTLNHGTFTPGSTVTVTAVNGVATFSSLQISSAGTYSLVAADGTLAVATSTSVTVNKATPIVSWPSPASITYGIALTSTQLDATSTVPGTFAYTPPAGTVLSPGANQVLSVVFTPTDTTDYATATASVSITVNSPQPISLTGSSFYLERDTTDPTLLDFWTGSTATGTPALSTPYASISSITLTANAPGDSFTTDFSNGTVVPVSGLSIAGDGPAAGNTLTVVGTQGADTVTVPGDGTFDLNSQTVNYDTGTIGNVYFQSPGIGEALTVPSGTVTLAPSTSAGIATEIFSSISIGSGATLAVAPAATSAQRVLLQTGGLTIAANAPGWTGTLDLANNDLDAASGDLTTIDSQVAQGISTGVGGIISSASLADSTHLTTLGAIRNTAGSINPLSPLYGSGTSLGLFDGVSPAAADVLVKYTYYGDANLDGIVDGSDYSLVDNGYSNQLTGWFNGDFNYDGVVDGTDYSLLDNAFNNQTPATPSAQTTPQAVVAAVVAAPVSNAVGAPAGAATMTAVASVKLPARPAPVFSDSVIAKGSPGVGGWSGAGMSISAELFAADPNDLLTASAS